MALEYLLDRRSTLLFGWFGEYSQLPNLGNRQSAFHFTNSATLTKINEFGWETLPQLAHHDIAPFDYHLIRWKKNFLDEDYSASNREERLYVTTKDRGVHRRQPLRVIVIKGIVMEETACIQLRYHTFRRQKPNHCLPFSLGADRQLSFHAETVSYTLTTTCCQQALTFRAQN
ncbi:hypothetical protein TNCV_4653401 [Trichonephila clavipes]|nr:hypothetical protein TNCV_4653401 [Trichonephila clavipes]